MKFEMQHVEPQGFVKENGTVASQQGVTDTAFPIRMARLAFPLRGPRTMTLAFWPVDVFCAAVDGYYQAFFMSLKPQGSPR